MESNSFIRQKQLLLQLPFSAPTLWRKVKAGSFPKPIKLGENITAWRVADIDAWLKELDRA
jgi:prophage regulatory protein